MKSKSLLTVSIVIALSACSNTPTRFVGASQNLQSTSDQSSSDQNVMFVYDGEKALDKESSLLVYPMNPKSKPSDVEKDFDVVTTVELSTSAKAKLSTPEPMPSELLASVSDSKIIADEKIIESISSALTPEDEILNSTINPIEYQKVNEHSFLDVQALNQRMYAEVDSDQVKAYLISEYYNTDDNPHNDREKLERPKTKFYFKARKGSLNQNIESLIENMDGVSAVTDISENHTLFNNFIIEGDSLLEILDQLIDSFTSPHPLKTKVHSINKVIHVYYKK